MEVISYNSELAIANLLFKRIFSNIKICRTDTTTNEKKEIPVMCVLEQRSRIMKNWENAEKRATYRLPLICINRTGYTRNSERVNNINNEVKYEITSKNRSENLLTPVPIDISYEVSIMAKYPSDIDQIASNFMVFFNNDIYVSCVHPKYNGIKMNNQIVMDDSISEEHSGEIDGSADDFITSTFSFTFKTYLFGGTQQAQLIPEKILSSFLSTVYHEDIFELTTKQKISSYLNDNTNNHNLSTHITFNNTNELLDFINNYSTKYNFTQLETTIKFSNKNDVFEYLNTESSIPKIPMSALLTSESNVEVSAYVDNPQASSYIYDGFVPLINELNFNFYAVPNTSAFNHYIDIVDSKPLSVQKYFVDSINWKIETMSEIPL